MAELISTEQDFPLEVNFYISIGWVGEYHLFINVEYKQVSDYYGSSQVAYWASGRPIQLVQPNNPFNLYLCQFNAILKCSIKLLV